MELVTSVCTNSAKDEHSEQDILGLLDYHFGLDFWNCHRIPSDELLLFIADLIGPKLTNKPRHHVCGLFFGYW
jgi:hypothetical protein